VPTPSYQPLQYEGGSSVELHPIVVVVPSAEESHYGDHIV